MKTTLANSSVILLCIAAIGLPCVLPSGADFDLNTAVGVWHMDEGQGDMTMDASPEGNHGVLWRDPLWVDGRFGKALQFDGQSFVWMKNATGVPEGTSPRTVMAHFKWAEINDFEDWEHWITDSETLVCMGKNNWRQRVSLQISAQIGPGGGLGVDTFQDRIMADWDEDTEWHHVAAVLPDGATFTSEFLIYLDGVLMEETEMARGDNNGFETVGGEVAIGCWTGGPINWFNGIIDDAAIFPFAMPEEDIVQVAKRGLARGQTMDVSPKNRPATSWGALKERN